MQLAKNEQIFETILLLPEIVKHSRISLMATNERPLSCSSCIFGPLSTSNSLNNLSGRRNSLLDTIEEESFFPAQILNKETTPSSTDEERKPLTRSVSAPELYSESLIMDSASSKLVEGSVQEENEPAAKRTLEKTESTESMSGSLKAHRFRGNKSMSVDATAMKESTSLLSHLKRPAFLAHILNPFLPLLKRSKSPPNIQAINTKAIHSNPPASDEKANTPGLFVRMISRDSIAEEECRSGTGSLEESTSDASASRETVPTLIDANKTCFSAICPAPSTICRPSPNVVLSNNTSSTTAPSTTTARRPRHSFAGQMSYSKLWGFGGGVGPSGKKMPTATSTNSLFSTAVISGSSSAPNLRDMIQNAAAPSGKKDGEMDD